MTLVNSLGNIKGFAERKRNAPRCVKIPKTDNVNRVNFIFKLHHK